MGKFRISKEKQEALFFILAGIAVFLFTLYRQRYFFHDDAFIELRYVRNFILAGDLSWNPGDRVEGFTSPLHVMLVSAIGSISSLELPTIARLVNFTALIGVFIGFSRALPYVATGTEKELRHGIGWALLLGCAPLVIWVWGGLEATLDTCCILAAQIPLFSALSNPSARLRKLAFCGALLGLAILVRPDSILFVGAIGLVILFFTHWTFRERILSGAILAAPVILIDAALLFFRYRYYGEFAPNTYYAKVYGIPLSDRLWLGLLYFKHSVVDMPMLAMFPFLVIFCPKAWRQPIVILLLVEIILFILGILWAGGDHMVKARMYIPLIPLLALLGAACVRTSNVYSRYAILVAVCLTMVASLFAKRQPMDAAAWAGEIVGVYISQHWPEGSLIALNTAGSTPYWAPNMRFIDMLGLNDRTIAHRQLDHLEGNARFMPGHAKGDGNYVLSRQPDFIIAEGAAGSEAHSARFPGDIEMAKNPEFDRCYKAENALIPYDDDYARIGPAQDDASHILGLIYYRRTCAKH